MTENMRTTRKAKALLNTLLAQRQISETGLSWLTVATDPFHDSEVSCSGYPDVSTSRSLVQTFTKTKTIAAPASITPTDTWDLHVFFNPCTSPTDLTDSSGRNGRLYTTTLDSFGRVLTQANALGQPTIVGGMNAISTPNGGGLASPSSNVATELQMPINLNSGPYRLIAVGFEVVNTTAELYKQGSMTCYKSPAGYSIESILPAITGSASTNPHIAEFATAPPYLQSEAALYPNSRTWEAKEGVYMVCTLNDHPSFIQPGRACAAGLNVDRGTVGINSGNLWYPLAGPEVNSPGTRLLPFDLSGAVFTGLHASSSMQVTARYVFERVPNIREPDLLVLTRVPASYDPLVLEMYSRAISQMPVGCMVKDNPLGEWFSDVLGFLRDAAPMAGNLLGTIVPGAGLAGRVIGSAAGAGQQAFKRANVPASPSAPSPARKKSQQTPKGKTKKQ